MRILLVDDSKTIRRVQKGILEQLGYSDIHEASDGQEALTISADIKPELILLDWNMPNMDGITFLKTYRGQGNTTPIIMVTTESEKERVMEAIQAGVNNYVVKPFTPEIMGKRINETIKKAA